MTSMANRPEKGSLFWKQMIPLLGCGQWIWGRELFRWWQSVCWMNLRRSQNHKMIEEGGSRYARPARITELFRKGRGMTRRNGGSPGFALGVLIATVLNLCVTPATFAGSIVGTYVGDRSMQSPLTALRSHRMSHSCSWAVSRSTTRLEPVFRGVDRSWR